MREIRNPERREKQQKCSTVARDNSETANAAGQSACKATRLRPGKKASILNNLGFLRYPVHDCNPRDNRGF
ncbi:MAG: hypothetical protein JWN45_2866 [Acidobacteriaceae bacterium]|nr:hypothetical protein [Acidobacteriaceae bacterium]